MLRLFIASMIFTISVLGFSQDRDAFEAYKKNINDKFDNYVSERDKAFAAFLKQRWEKFETFKARTNEKVLPPKPTLFIPPAMEEPPVEINIGEVEKEKPPIEQPKLKEPPVPTQKPTDGRKIPITLYGLDAEVTIDHSFSLQLKGINEDNVADGFTQLARKSGQSLVQQIAVIGNTAKLSDWHLYKLVDYIGQRCFSNRPNEQVLFAFYALRELGMKVKIGRSENKLILMIPFVEQIYACSSIVSNGVSYYIVSPSGEEIYTYNTDKHDEGKYPEIRIKETPRLPLATTGKKVLIKRNNQQVEALYNKNLELLYADYPQCDVVNYARAPLSDELKKSLITQLKTMVEGVPKADAANMLINFVQTSFDYKTDTEQFGRQRPFFAEEMFVFPYSDCKDRSVIYSQLIRNVLGLEVVLLDYPNHIATAVCFGNEEVSGDYLIFEGKKYIVCDPTYINASIGRAMPQYKNVNPIVIQL